MKVGVPTETKADEYRVALTPVGARELSEHGHDVLVQRGAEVDPPLPRTGELVHAGQQDRPVVEAEVELLRRPGGRQGTKGG